MLRRSRSRKPRTSQRSRTLACKLEKQGVLQQRGRGRVARDAHVAANVRGDKSRRWAACMGS